MGDERSKAGRRVVNSFMVRFVNEAIEKKIASEADERLDGWRGVIQHIQTGAEFHFNRFEEAEAFMMKYLQT